MNCEHNRMWWMLHPNDVCDNCKGTGAYKAFAGDGKVAQWLQCAAQEYKDTRGDVTPETRAHKLDLAKWFDDAKRLHALFDECAVFFYECETCGEDFVHVVVTHGDAENVPDYIDADDLVGVVTARRAVRMERL